jgi:hypothetical protein
MPVVGVDRFEDRAACHMISHMTELMLAAISVIWAIGQPVVGPPIHRHDKVSTPADLADRTSPRSAGART